MGDTWRCTTHDILAITPGTPLNDARNAGFLQKVEQMESKFKKVSIEELCNPQKSGPLMVYRNHYWLADDDNNVLFYDTGRSLAPQCNIDPKIIVLGIKDPEQFTIKFIPWAYVKFDVADYR